MLGQLERLAAAVVLEPRACDEAAVRMLAHAALASANQSWPPFVLVAGLILIGAVAAERLEDGERNNRQQVRLRIGLGAAATLAAATFVVTLPNAALPVLVVGVAVTAVRRIRPQLDARVLAPLFVLAVALGTIARLWRGPAHLLDSSGTWAAAGIGVVASVLINNLPAAVLLSAKPATHPYALSLGLNLGPNLAITGSLSAFLWLQAARTVNANANASITTYSRLGQCSYH